MFTQTTEPAIVQSPDPTSAPTQQPAQEISTLATAMPTPGRLVVPASMPTMQKPTGIFKFSRGKKGKGALSKRNRGKGMPKKGKKKKASKTGMGKKGKGKYYRNGKGKR